jgi:hypothetical protein
MAQGAKLRNERIDFALRKIAFNPMISIDYLISFFDGNTLSEPPHRPRLFYKSSRLAGSDTPITSGSTNHPGERR